LIWGKLNYGLQAAKMLGLLFAVSKNTVKSTVKMATLEHALTGVKAGQLVTIG
jgi:hypothetical protein